MSFGRKLFLLSIIMAFVVPGVDALASCSWYNCNTESDPPTCDEYVIGEPPPGSYYVSDCRVVTQCMPIGGGWQACHTSCKFTFCYMV